MSKSMKSRDKVAVTVRISRVIKKKMDEIVFATRRTRGGYIELALEDRFTKDIPKPHEQN